MEDGENWYGYCNNNPVMYVDPDGKVAFWLLALLGFAFGQSFSNPDAGPGQMVEYGMHGAFLAVCGLEAIQTAKIIYAWWLLNNPNISNRMGSMSSRLTTSGPRRVYRIIRPDEDPTKGLTAKDPTASYSIGAHVSSGSKYRTQYISSTTDLNVARQYATQNNCRIVQIDLNKIPDCNIYDLSTVEGRAAYINPRNIWANNFAKSSSEVLIVGKVPPKAVKLIK